SQNVRNFQEVPRISIACRREPVGARNPSRASPQAVAPKLNPHRPGGASAKQRGARRCRRRPRHIGRHTRRCKPPRLSVSACCRQIAPIFQSILARPNCACRPLNARDPPLLTPDRGRGMKTAPPHSKRMAEDEKSKLPHTLADHLYGRDIAHVHASDADHDHDHDFDDDGPVEDNPLWQQDNVALATVGIDIGSAGTQVIFSRVHLRRVAEDLTSRYYVVARETLFQSAVTLTPYLNEQRIDGARLGAIIDGAYNAAGLAPAQIDTGVVILTGEALRRENAQAIAAILSEKGGEFVTATAGHHMEAMLAAYGSGAARVSSDQSKRILNI